MILYFSGTGNSRYAAEYIAALTEDKTEDAGQLIRGGEKDTAFTSEKPFVFVCPVYGWQIPHVFRDFIRSASFFGTQKAYFVITCGQDIGNAGAYAQKICAEKNLHFQGVFPVIMPENYIAMFDAPGTDEAEKILDAADPAIEEAAGLIKGRESFPETRISLMDRLKSSLIHRVFYRFFVKAKGFRTTEACIGCGKCERGCVLNNIHMKQGRPVWGENCTHCMACICRCPREAIEYKNISVGKVRYENNRKVKKKSR